MSALAGWGAVVTGGGRGIGAAVARALAQAGARVLVTARTEAEITRTAASLADDGHDATAHPCDVTSETEVAELARVAAERLGTVDILVNNAGASTAAPLARVTLADWERMLRVNATSTFLCTRAFLPGMVERGRGRVVNVASVAGLGGARYITAYTAAKHAVVGFTRAAATEVAGRGVSVNAVCPGYVDTPMTEASLRNIMERTGRSREDAMAGMLGVHDQPRLIAPDEVAAAVVRYCTADADVNGEARLLDGREDA